MSEWEIPFEEYLERIQFSPEHFKERLELPKIKLIKKVIPLRNMIEIKHVIPLRKDFFEKIIRGIKTLDKTLKPFEFSEIKLVKFDPNQLKVAQKFIYREKYQKLVEEMPEIFKDFLINAGFCDLGAFMVFGFDAESNRCLSYYIPPIIEKHDRGLIIMDGIHRNYINKQMGHTITSVLIDGVGAPFPCSFRSWEEVQIISLEKKPSELEKRYFDLEAHLFRDLKYLGIDG